MTVTTINIVKSQIIKKNSIDCFLFYSNTNSKLKFF